MIEMEKIVIIGGGQAAAWAVHTLRANSYEGGIAVVCDEENCFYERPPLSKEVLLGSMTHEALQIFQKEVVSSFRVEFYCPYSAELIDRHKQVVILNDGTELAYDKVLIATGSKARIPNPDWLLLKNIYSLRTIPDSLKLQALQGKVKTMAIIGGGWIGLEIAASMQKQGVQVTVLEMADRLCLRSVSPEVSEFLKQLHEEEGIRFKLNCGAIDLEQFNGDQVEVFLNAKTWEVFDTVLVGAGAHINKEIAEQAGLETNVGIVVNEYSQTSDPLIYAAGDVAVHPELGFCIQSWANAQNQGINAAKNMLGQEEVYDEIPWLWSDQFGCNIQILGFSNEIKKCTLVQRDIDSHKKCFFYLDQDNCLQYLVAVNDPKTIKIAKRWMQANLVLDPEQLRDSTFNLMSIKAKK